MDKIKERNIFAKTLYFEAGSTCGIQEVLYIAYVIRNRVDGKRWFGNNYVEVCLKKWQFSCWNGKTLEEIERIDLDAKRRWQTCLMVAEYIMQLPKGEIPKKMRGVCNYCNLSLCNPSWIKKMRKVYPLLNLKHSFYRE